MRTSGVPIRAAIAAICPLSEVSTPTSVRPHKRPPCSAGAWRIRVRVVTLAADKGRDSSFTSPLFLLCHGAMSKTILVTGGARSGKSAIAEGRIAAFPGAPIYIATAEVRDDEMAARVALHKARRGSEWVTHQVPFDLVATLQATDGAGPR